MNTHKLTSLNPMEKINMFEEKVYKPALKTRRFVISTIKN